MAWPALVPTRHVSWATALVVGGVALVAVSLVLFGADLAPLLVTTLGALVGGTAFVLGVSATIAAFLQRDSYADSDFWR